MKRNVQIYSFSVVFILIITGVGKVWSAFGGVKALGIADPLFGLQFRYLMFVAGAMELSVAAFYLFANDKKLFLPLVAWLSSFLLIYCLTLELIGWHLPCGCMGYFTDALHIPPRTADTVMKIIL